MKVFVDFLYDNGTLHQYELHDPVSKEEAEEAIEKTTELFYESFRNDKCGAFKFTDVDNNVVVVNMKKVSSFRMSIGE